MGALRTLLQNAIDYAGLFPPASLSMADAVENYQRDCSSSESWMLGRFVLPAARLDEFAALLTGPAPPVTVVLGGEIAADLERIEHSPLPIDRVERKAGDVAQIEAAMMRIPPRLTPYFEIAQTGLIPSLAGAGARAKIRMGGTTVEAIPSSAHVVKFITMCATHKVPFKATAGLHHAVRSFCRVADSPDSHATWMHGFLNLLIAAVLAHKGASHGAVERALLEEAPESSAFGDGRIEWAGETVTVEQIAAARRDFAISFGSCSFEEPVADLKSRGWLSP